MDDGAGCLSACIGRRSGAGSEIPSVHPMFRPREEPPPAEGPPIPFRAEVVRKAIHLLALAVPLGMALLGKTWAVALLVPMALCAVSADVLRVRSERFARVIGRVFGFMMRAEERPPVGGRVRINGATWVLISAAVLAVVFPIRIAVPAFAVFMVADAAAALVGRRLGRHRWPGTSRTVEGTLAFLVTALVLVAPFPGLVYWTAAVAMTAAAAAEILPRPLNDNIRVPVVAATLIFLLERFALGRDVVLFF